ncbi:hypothetical protein GALMADRAFT_126732 [Galerina marginata CBS 339.88]|uniref:Nephrocystin 3-like N-terminal domain-containing protein n=1 Tax=Galerina marginata (strain CBS 339.88) TaxID=685588 RepID=A0A067SYF7_GALM3|nr:hypothetical protein GALMADRAFT_126732 [Galerina marginata CBS 339.88]
MSSPRALISHSVITGGTFIQHTHDNRRIQIQGGKSGFDRLQDAVAPAAFHNSGERFDPPKCHPNTRVAVMKKIMDWIQGQDSETRNALIMWLNGAAGAGKSAIAQSIAELCCAQECLLASFFFGRSDPNRNHARSLFPTIAYQMVLAIPQLREKLVAIIEFDPLIFTRGPSVQFLSLIVKPLRELLDSGFFNDPSSPRLVIIDGLDECLDRRSQCEILDIIVRGIQQDRLPLIFLIASRPEHEISTKFNSPRVTSILTRLVLDDSYLPDNDIELFLRDKCKEITETHAFKQYIPPSWPADDIIYDLVDKSSGQFIYASTVVKYVESSRHHPHHRLEVVLNLRPARRDLPFADLDALYTHILASVDEIEEVLDILTFLILEEIPSTTGDSFEKLFSLDPGDIQRLFCDLGSIVTGTATGDRMIHILHASLADFLLDQSRSQQFSIDVVSRRTDHLRKCFQLLINKPFTDRSMGLAWSSALNFIHDNLLNCSPSPELWRDFTRFSVVRIYGQALRIRNVQDYEKALIQEFNYLFLPRFFEFLRALRSGPAEALYTYHLRCFDEVLRGYLDAYYRIEPLAFLIALLDFSMTHQQHGHYMFIREFRLYKLDPALNEVDGRCLALLTDRISYKEYHQLIYDFLEDPVRSKHYALNVERYASAALRCLIYLCDHRSAPQSFPPQRKRNIRIRRNAPWTWFGRMGTHGALRKSEAWRRRENDHVYKHKREDLYFFPESQDMEDPHFIQRLWAQKYSLALEYLLHFLPRAGRSEELLKFCSRRTLAPRSREFRNKSKEVRRAMETYVTRMEASE